MAFKWKWTNLAVAAAMGMMASTAAAAEHASIQTEHVDGPVLESTGFDVVPVSDGGWIVTGSKDRQFTLQKFTQQGNLLWETAFYPGLVGKAIIETTDGGYLAGGQTFYQSDEVGVQAFLIKVDKDGNMEWLQEVGDKAFDSITSIAELTDGYVLSGSLFEANTTKSALVHIDKQGQNIQFVALSSYFPANEAFVSSTLATNDGGILITNRQEKALADAGVQVSTRLVKLNAAFQKQWELMLPGDVLSGKVLPDGAIYAARGISGNLNLTRVDATGKITWTRTHASGSTQYYEINGYDIAASPDGGFVIAGALSSTSSQTGYLLKVDASGNKLWDQTLYSNNSWIQGIASNGSNQFAVTGHVHLLGTPVPKLFFTLLQTNRSYRGLTSNKKRGAISWARSAPLIFEQV